MVSIGEMDARRMEEFATTRSGHAFEPSLGLSPQAMGMVFDTIRELTASGLSVLMVEQNARQALECCDYGVVMELGRSKLFDRAPDVLAHPEIRRLFLGL